MKFLSYSGLTKLVRLIKEKYAPLVSPTLTGVPTAPTAESGTNTTQVATTAFVQDAIDSYVPEINGISNEDIADAWDNIDPTDDTPSGEYNKIDLAGYATEAYVNAAIADITDVNTSWDNITDKPELATVAISGSYDDLSDKPNIPEVPTNISAFINDANYATESYIDTAIANSANDKIDTDSENYIKSAAVSNNTLTLTKGNDTTISYTPMIASSTNWADIPDKPTFATVATSGSYEDLSDKPTIPTVPTAVSAFTNDSDYATETYVDTAVSNLVNSAPATLDTLNELASALGNDPNFATTVATNIGNKVSIDSADYIKSAAVNNNTLTLTKGDNTTVAFTNIVYDAMTAAQATAGTSTDAVLVSPKVLADYISSRLSNLNYLSTSGGTVNGNITLRNNGHIILPSGVELY